ncbi:MAG: HAD-IIA family hydrolase [Chloroflexi bacterium]|nr:HAD-IIA family hydrolase [Chloroflexota bacterium]MBK6711676.1 HAD-IIA family hydrolase [Chloroflexota bacterium]MBK7177110.1 HAD-IIA family hydrolase [Chloroflexota bacterium]MBP6806020.1 HAD-IIA family hydrolase [Chloroflexota bacterium]
MTLAPIKNLILDMDGVLWRGDTPLPGLADFFAALRRREMGFALATNNATKTAVMYTEKLARFGVDVAPEHIVTSAEATAAFLRQEYEVGTAVYVVGDKGLHDAVTAQGFTIITPEQAKAGAQAAVVVAGFSRTATYEIMAMGAHLINQGARYIGTNPDPSFPSEIGPLPGAGALLAFIETGTGVKPTIIGKPGPIMFQQAMRRMGGTPENTAMVGDRLSTDILGAKNAGLQAILVLSGISTRADVAEQGIEPDFIFADIGEITAVLSQEA